MWLAKLLKRITRKKKHVDLKTIDTGKQTIIHINIITQIQVSKPTESETTSNSNM